MDNNLKSQYYQYILKLGNIELKCGFAFPETASYFGNWCISAANIEPEVIISDWFWQKVNQDIGPKSPYIEYTAFSTAASVFLLGRDSVLLHAVSFRWNNRAWLITGSSGAGKSTQIRILKQLDKEFSVISGDRPVLQKNEDGSFFVHPSPWNGKEGWCGAEGAHLAGIICLQRGFENRIEKLPTKEAAPLIFKSIFQTGEHEEDVRKAARLEESLLQSVPIWKLTSFDVPDSTKLLYNTLFAGNNIL